MLIVDNPVDASLLTDKEVLELEPVGDDEWIDWVAKYQPIPAA